MSQLQSKNKDTNIQSTPVINNSKKLQLFELLLELRKNKHFFSLICVSYVKKIRLFFKSNQFDLFYIRKCINSIKSPQLTH